jgi:ADP-ribose pyrophosphatase YjhB (NUDIX family)
MDVLKLFQYAEKLKFSDIEKALKVRSNKLSYHLNNLTKKGVLIKEGDYYLLSESSEMIIPYLTGNQSPLPVILILLGNNKKALLYKRKKRPYKDLFSLPGGRILLGETLEVASKRIMKNKFNLNVEFKKVNSVSFEQVKKSEKIMHAFVLFFVTVTTKDKVELLEVANMKTKTISSDYKLIIEDSNKKINVPVIFSESK